jgi:hypothetical protein
VLALPRPRDPSHPIFVDGLEMGFDSQAGASLAPRLIATSYERFNMRCWASSMAVATPAPSAIISRISDIGVG